MPYLQAGFFDVRMLAFGPKGEQMSDDPKDLNSIPDLPCGCADGLRKAAAGWGKPHRGKCTRAHSGFGAGILAAHEVAGCSGNVSAEPVTPCELRELVEKLAACPPELRPLWIRMTSVCARDAVEQERGRALVNQVMAHIEAEEQANELGKIDNDPKKWN